MKPRRVIVQIEMDTDVKTKDLKEHYLQSQYIPLANALLEPIQVTVNVIQNPKPLKRR